MNREKWNQKSSIPKKYRPAASKPVALNRLDVGVVVLAHIPFVDGDGEKTRPAVVVGVRGREVELLPVTSSPRRHEFSHGYLEIGDLEGAGLGRACAVRLRRVVVDRIELVHVLGHLGEDDLTNLQFSVAA